MAESKPKKIKGSKAHGTKDKDKKEKALKKKAEKEALSFEAMNNQGMAQQGEEEADEDIRLFMIVSSVLWYYILTMSLQRISNNAIRRNAPEEDSNLFRYWKT